MPLLRVSQRVVVGEVEAERRHRDVGALDDRAIAFAKTEEGELVLDPSRRGEELRRDLRLVRAFLPNLEAHRCTLTLDSALEETGYLLLEVTNTDLIGPNAVLAPA